MKPLTNQPNVGAADVVVPSRRDVARLRLSAQGLTGERRWDGAVAVVSAFGLMQAQEYSSVVRSVRLRTLHQDDLGDLVRGYPMRGTIFLGTRADMGWITQLCAKVKDEPWTPAAFEVFEELFGSGARVSRAEFKAVAEQALERHSAEIPKVPSPYWVLKHLMERRMVFYTGRDQQIEALALPDLDSVFNGDRQAAATELATRYFRTHGPATLEDFHWWTKLPKAMVRQAINELPDDIERVGSYLMPAGLEAEQRSVHLLSPFDEYILGYQDRLFAMDMATHQALVPKNMGVFRKSIVVDGQVRGIWGPKGIEDHGLPKYSLKHVERLHNDARK